MHIHGEGMLGGWYLTRARSIWALLGMTGVALTSLQSPASMGAKE